MKTSIIIPAYGFSPHLDEVLSAIYDGSANPTEVIVSHSGSDNPAVQLSEKYSQVRWLHSDNRLFAGAARNAGVSAAIGDLLVFCDSDVVPDKSWLQEILDSFLCNQNIFIVGAVGVLKSGGYWGMSNWICEFSEQAPWRPSGLQTGGASCNMAILARDFKKIGGFSELRAGEDTVFLATARQHGITQIFASQICVYHANHKGFSAFAKHQYAIGKSFAITRQKKNLKGRLFIRLPILTPLLWAPKSYVVLSRAFRAGGKGLIQGIMLCPGILTGSFIFTAGACSEVFRSHTLSQ